MARAGAGASSRALFVMASPDHSVAVRSSPRRSRRCEVCTVKGMVVQLWVPGMGCGRRRRRVGRAVSRLRLGARRPGLGSGSRGPAAGGSAGGGGERFELAEGGEQLAGPGPAALEVQLGAAAVEGEPCRDVEQPVAQSLGL